MALLPYGANITPLIDPDSFTQPLTRQKQCVSTPTNNVELSPQAPTLQNI